MNIDYFAEDLPEVLKEFTGHLKQSAIFHEEMAKSMALRARLEAKEKQAKLPASAIDAADIAGPIKKENQENFMPPPAATKVPKTTRKNSSRASATRSSTRISKIKTSIAVKLENESVRRSTRTKKRKEAEDASVIISEQSITSITVNDDLSEKNVLDDQNSTRKESDKLDQRAQDKQAEAQIDVINTTFDLQKASCDPEAPKINLKPRQAVCQADTTFVVDKESCSTPLAEKKVDSLPMENFRVPSKQPKNIVQQSGFANSPVKSMINNFEKLIKTKIPTTQGAQKANNDRVASGSQTKQVITPIGTRTRAMPAHSKIETKGATGEINAVYEKLQSEKKRKLEERHFKAQQFREQQEREKREQLLHYEKQKQERLLNAQKKKELLQQKQRKESEMRRKAAAERAYSQKQKANRNPIYFVQPLPPLPTKDYRKNEEEQAKEKCKSVKLKNNFGCVLARQFFNTLFFVKPETPILTSIFVNIPEDRLHRNSSAVWDNVPDFTKILTDDYFSDED